MALLNPSEGPLLEYAVPVWHVHFVKDKEAFESVPKFSAKIYTKN